MSIIDRGVGGAGERAPAWSRRRHGLSVKGQNATKAFFAVLGFTFNPQFTDDSAACMIVSEEAYVMLLTEPFFWMDPTKTQ